MNTCPDCQHEYLVALTNTCNTCGQPLCQRCKSDRNNGRGIKGRCRWFREDLYQEKVILKRKG